MPDAAVHWALMNITPDPQDADAFTHEVEAVANGLMRVHAPRSVHLIKVSSWFGFKWLGFSGKALGAVGVWREPVTVPPFVPSRIVSQRRFASPNYLEGEEGAPVHMKVSGTKALRRTLSIRFVVSVAVVSVTASAFAFLNEPTGVLFWHVGDDGLSERLAEKVEKGFKTSLDFSLSDLSDSAKPGTLVVRIPTNVGWKKVGKRIRVSYAVEFSTPDKQSVVRNGGSCWDDQLGGCVVQLLMQARVARHNLR